MTAKSPRPEQPAPDKRPLHVRLADQIARSPIEGWCELNNTLVRECIRASKERDRLAATLREYIAAAGYTVHCAEGFEADAMIRFGGADIAARAAISELERK